MDGNLSVSAGQLVIAASLIGSSITGALVCVFWLLLGTKDKAYQDMVTHKDKSHEDMAKEKDKAYADIVKELTARIEAKEEYHKRLEEYVERLRSEMDARVDGLHTDRSFYRSLLWQSASINDQLAMILAEFGVAIPSELKQKIRDVKAGKASKHGMKRGNTPENEQKGESQ